MALPTHIFPHSAFRKAMGMRLTLFFVGAACALFLAGCETLSYGPGAGAFNTVVIDAGHGAHDRGARAVVGPHEKVVALDIAQRVARELRRAGFHVVMTRNSDVFIPLATRAAISNRTPGSVFVSIHLNWARRRAANGAETYYHTVRSRRLAANIQYRLVRNCGATNRGVKYARFHVLRNNRRPAVLVECGFLSNPAEARKLQSSGYRQKVAKAIAEGIIAERQGRSP